MCIRTCVVFSGVLLLSGCAGMESASTLGLAQQAENEGTVAGLISTPARPQINQACYTLPRGTMSRGPNAKYCINTPNGFMCVSECRRER